VEEYMRKAVVLVLLGLALSVGLGMSVAPPEVIRAQHAAVRFVSYNPNTGDYRAFCSGAVLEFEGVRRVVGAGHCFADHKTGQPKSLRYVYIQDIRGNLYNITPESIVFVPDVGNDDYAIFRSAYSYLVKRPIKVAERVVEPGDRVFSWAAPHGFGLLLMHGYVMGRLDSPIPNLGVVQGMWTLDINGEGGSSGSIILNGRGEAVGIHVRALVGNQRLTMAFMAELPYHREDWEGHK
jgi:hypothetical protein